MLEITMNEFQNRISNLRQRMAERAIDLFVISDKDNFEYFGGYRSLFWASKARPFFLVVPREGDLFVVASASEARAFSQTLELAPTVKHAPYSGFTTECIKVILELASKYDVGHVAFDYGFECFGFGSIELVDSIRAKFPNAKLSEGADDIWKIRIVKSATEIAQKRQALKISTDAFTEALSQLQIGQTEKEFAQMLTLALIGGGATSVPWLPVRFGRGNFAYSLPPTDRKLQRNDFIWVDIGAVFGTSISDVNRIAKAGPVSAEEQAIYTQVRTMTIATLAAIKPGMTGAQVYKTFEDLAKDSSIGLPSATASRIGHGGGSNLTEPPSISPTSEEVLSEGMIIHVEPKYEIGEGVFQLEEVALVTASGSELITDLAPEEMPSIN